MKKVQIIFILLLMGFNCLSQEANHKLTYYNANELGLSLWSHNNLYPELRIESDNLDFEDALYSFILKKDFAINKDKAIDFSCGLGASYSQDGEELLFIPFYLVQNNLFNSHLSVSLGLDFKSDLADEFKCLPKIGLSINF